MEVLVSGHNGFGQLKVLNVKRLNDKFEDSMFNHNSDESSLPHHISPILLLSTSKHIDSRNISVHFTWSRCITSIKAANKCATIVTGYNMNKDETPELVLENVLCKAVADVNILITTENTTDEERVMGLYDGMSQPFTVSFRSRDAESSSVNLQHTAGGVKDFYSVYDGISFGIFRLPDVPTPSNSKLDNEDDSPHVSEPVIIIHHLDCVIPIKEISCGKEHVLLLATSGNVYSYGLSSRGQLGHGDVENRSSPTLIDALDGVAMETVVTGGWHSTAVSEIGDLYVWGWNDCGQLGLGSNVEGDVQDKRQHEDTGIVALPACIDIPGGENITGVACGSRHTVVLTESGKIFTCGWNGYGQLGLGDTRNRHGLTKVNGLKCSRVFAGHWNSAFICTK